MTAEEENLARLVRTALPPGRARLESRARDACLAALLEEQRRRSAAHRFPERVLLGMSWILAGAMAILATGASGIGATLANGPAADALTLLVVVNLLMVPFAGIVIVVQRRHASTQRVEAGM
jgi:hypothetical protein